MKKYKNYEALIFYPIINCKFYKCHVLYNDKKSKLEIVKLMRGDNNVVGLLYYNDSLLEKIGMAFFKDLKFACLIIKDYG